MSKRIIQALIILVVILFGVSLVSEVNNKSEIKETIEVFDEVVSKEEVENGNIEDINIVKEDSSNIISRTNAKIATVIVGGLNLVFKLGLNLIAGLTN